MTLPYRPRSAPVPATGRQRATVLQVLRLCGGCASCLPEGKRHRCPTGGPVGLRSLACDEWTPLDGVAPATRAEQLAGCAHKFPAMTVARPAQVKAEGRVDAMKGAREAAAGKRRDRMRGAGLRH